MGPTLPPVMIRDSSAGIQRPGSYTCSTPTIEFTPEQISTRPSSRARCSGVRTIEGAQKSGDITAKYTIACASPPTSDVVWGLKRDKPSTAITASSHDSTLLASDRTFDCDSHQPKAPRLIAKAEK